MTKHKYADVITAWANGETIQFCFGGTWFDFDNDGDLGPWNSPINDWRVKPKSVTVWVNVYSEDCVGGYETKKQADDYAGPSRIACVPLTYTEGEGLSPTAAAGGL